MDFYTWIRCRIALRFQRTHRRCAIFTRSQVITRKRGKFRATLPHFSLLHCVKMSTFIHGFDAKFHGGSNAPIAASLSLRVLKLLHVKHYSLCNTCALITFTVTNFMKSYVAQSVALDTGFPTKGLGPQLLNAFSSYSAGSVLIAWHGLCYIRVWMYMKFSICGQGNARTPRRHVNVLPFQISCVLG
jgi:hypothetical protein